MAKKARKTKKKAAKKKSRPKTAKVVFDYIKSCQFRVVRIDGIHGGINPQGNAIQMACFSERNPIPKREVYEIVDGRLKSNDKIEVEIRQAVVREVEFEALLNLDVAQSLRAWLDDKIQQLESIQTA